MAHHTGAISSFSSMKGLGVSHSFIHVCGERLCESQVSWPRTEHHAPGQCSNPDCSIQSKYPNQQANKPPTRHWQSKVVKHMVPSQGWTTDCSHQTQHVTCNQLDDCVSHMGNVQQFIACKVHTNSQVKAEKPSVIHAGNTTVYRISFGHYHFLGLEMLKLV